MLDENTVYTLSMKNHNGENEVVITGKPVVIKKALQAILGGQECQINGDVHIKGSVLARNFIKSGSNQPDASAPLEES